MNIDQPSLFDDNETELKKLSNRNGTKASKAAAARIAPQLKGIKKQKLVSAWSDPELFYHKAKSYRLGNYEGDVLIPRVYRKLWRAEKDFDIHMQLNEEEGRDLPIQIWAVVEGLE